MKTKLLPLLLLISCSTFAQEYKNDDFFPQFTFGIGGSFQKFDNLNERIAKYPQYKKLPNYQGTIELGVLKQRHRVVSDMNLMLGSSFTDHRKQGSVIRFAGINIGVGYDLVPDKRISFYPLVGIGLEAFQARFYKDVSSTSFESLLQEPSVQSDIHSVDFTNYFFNYRAGFGVTFISSRKPYGSIGLQALYTGSFNKQVWKSNQGQSLGAAPEDRLNQFHVALLFGMQPMMMNH